MTTYLLQTDMQRSTLGGQGFPGRAYSAYGDSASPVGPMQGFAGQGRDIATGWYHLGNGHRVYNPILMRFHSADRLSPFGRGGSNAYAYCLGDPVNRHDPSGRIPQFLGPIISFMANALGLLASGLRFRGLRNIHRSYNPNSGFPGSRLGHVATGTIDLRPPRPTASDWTLSAVSAVTGGAGATMSAMRALGAMDNDGFIYTNMALTGVSIATTAVEVFQIATQSPGFYPIGREGSRFSLRSGSPMREGIPAPTTASSEIRGVQTTRL